VSSTAVIGKQLQDLLDRYFAIAISVASITHRGYFLFTNIECDGYIQSAKKLGNAKPCGGTAGKNASGLSKDPNDVCVHGYGPPVIQKGAAAIPLLRLKPRSFPAV
jgi:hypothetical protein